MCLPQIHRLYVRYIRFIFIQQFWHCSHPIYLSLPPIEATDAHAKSLIPQLQNALQNVAVDPGDHGNLLLQKLGSSFRRWCRQVAKIEIPPCTWNLHLLGRGDNDKKNYPELDSNVKAAHTKPILFFICEVAKEVSTLCQCVLIYFGKLFMAKKESTHHSQQHDSFFFKSMCTLQNCIPKLTKAENVLYASRLLGGFASSYLRLTDQLCVWERSCESGLSKVGQRAWMRTQGLQVLICKTSG